MLAKYLYFYRIIMDNMWNKISIIMFNMFSKNVFKL